MTPTIDVQSTYTGGAIIISAVSTGAYTLSRSVSGGPFMQIGSGTDLAVFLDVGENLPGPLDPTLPYAYQLTDINGTVTSTPVTPASNVTLEIEPLMMVIQRLLQGAINGMVAAGTLPPGIKAPDKVLLAMPIGGLPSFPIITINLDLLQQEEVPIGQSFLRTDSAGDYILHGFAKRIYTISVLCADAITRDFYREAIVRWWLLFAATVFNQIGQNITHRYQVASGQVAKDEKAPGFYYADMMVQINGTLNAKVSPGFGLIETIDITTNNQGETDQIIIT